jgi:predicted MPP superfamily phosphohydrolase
MSRRTFFRITGTAAATFAATASYGYGVEAHRLVTEHVQLPLPGLAPRWIGKRIVQLTDLHVNGADSPALVGRAFAMALDCKPEMIVVTGDWVNDTLEHFADVRGALALVPPEIPVVGILGNHDYGYHKYWRAIDVELCALLKEEGVRVLRNELWQPFAGPGELCFAGLEDYWCQRCDPAVLAAAPKDAPLLVLSHNPDSFDVMAPYRWDAVLCGHTHGGQVRIPGIGALKVPVAHSEWSAGLYHPDGAARIMYVSRGVGHWFRIRLFCPPEVTCLTLTRA